MASHRHFVLIVVFFLLAGFTSVYAQSSTARFLYFRPNAISSAMGGIGVAYFHDAYSAWFNPAGLAFSPTLSVAGSFDEPLPIFPGEG